MIVVENCDIFLPQKLNKYKKIIHLHYRHLIDINETYE